MDFANGNVAVGVFTDRGRAECAVEELLRNGFMRDQIRFVLPPGEEGAEEQSFARPRSKTAEGVQVGAAIGLGVGALAGAAAVSFFVPEVGPFLAGGFPAVLLGSAAGATTGGVLGALIGMSVPEDDARVYERRFHLGHTFVIVEAEGRYEEAEAILKRAQESPEPKLPHHGRGRLAGLAEETTGASGSGSAFVPEP
jgi:hypothetical protein